VVSPECALPTRYRVIRRLPRRPVLLGLAAAAVAVPAAGLLAGCGAEEPDPLTALATRARSDADLIDSILNVGLLGAALSTRLGPVVDARRQHAVALGVELGDTSPTTAPRSTGPTPSGETDVDSALQRVRAALDDSARQAGLAVLTLPRQRAALAGSIAACCAAYQAVLQ
jgi:hypothetical protein